MLVLAFSIVIFICVMSMAMRGRQVQAQLQRVDDRRRAITIADSALAEGLALAHRRVHKFKNDWPEYDHDAIFEALYGMTWDLEADVSEGIIENTDVFSIVKLEASIPDDTPLVSGYGHTCDLEVKAWVKIERSGEEPRYVRVRDRRTFRMSHCVMIVYLARRANQYHIEVSSNPPS